MKLWKIIATTICFIFLYSVPILANQWSWDIGDYHYDLVKDVQYNEWNKTDVTVYSDYSNSYVLFTAGPITGELAQFEVCIYDSNYDVKYLYTNPSGLSHTMSFSEIRQLNLPPDTYKLSIVAKGFEDEALDDYTLYVSYVGPDNSTDEVITDKNNTDEIITDKNNTGEVITNESNNIKTEKNDITSNQISATTKENATTVSEVTPPKRVTLQSAKRLKNNKKKVKITWKKLKSSNIKYQIKCSTSRKFAKTKTKTYTTKKHTFTISKLAKNKKYYIKVRSYKTVNGRKVYGSYSKIKIIKKIK